MVPGSASARLGAAFAASLTAHVLLAWGLGALLGLPGVDAGGSLAGTTAVAARLLGGEQVAQAPAQPAAAPAGSGGRRAVGTARAPRYLPAAELEARPQIMSRVNPEYPKDLVAGSRGRVVLELFIARDGTLDRVQVARAEPPGRFEDSALKAFSGARFTPGMKNGIPVPSLMRIEVTYGD